MHPSRPTPKPEARCGDAPLAVLVLVSPAVSYLSVDGPAIRVRAQGRADTWYPFARISQLECHGPVPCSPTLTASLLKQQIPVHWYASDGTWLGVSLPWQVREQTLAAKLTSLQALTDSQTRLRYFLAAEQRRAILKFLRVSALRVPSLEVLAVEAEFLKQLHYHLSDTKQVLMQINQVLGAQVVQAWYAKGLPIVELAPPKEIRALPPMLVDLLQWRAWGQVWECRRTLEQIWRNPTQKLTFLGHLSKDAQHQANLAITRFEHWLDGELLNPDC